MREPEFTAAGVLCEERGLFHGHVGGLGSAGLFVFFKHALADEQVRLRRRLCPFCKQPVELDRAMLEANKVDPAVFDGAEVFGPVGCPKCHGSGYRGRGAMMEVLPVSPKIRALIEKGGDAELLKVLALEEGMVTLKEAGMRKVRAGLTSLQAAFEVTGGE